MDTLPYISADQLRIGLYVYVDLPWLKHPFTSKRFRVSSEKQISELRALGEPRFRYDPERSDAGVPPEARTGETPTSAPAREPSGKISGKHVLNKHQQRFEQVDQAFLESTALLRDLNCRLLADSRETLQEIDTFVEQMTQSFLEHPEVTLHLIGEERRDEDIYSHHLNVAVLCMILARELGLPPDQTRLLGQGALLHDIGLTSRPDHRHKIRPEDYSPQERDLYTRHCEQLLRLGKGLDLPEEILSIIFQHHEMVDGSGYPLGIKGEQMTPLARIVSLVDYYERLCNSADPTQSMTPHGALSLMFGKKRAQFDAVVLKQLIRCLGVYPPGTIVKLSNNATAMVLSANPARPLRPWVMVYDERIPKDEALLLDLEQEHGVHIVGALRPVMLPSAVAAYLSPRKRVIYFFDNDAQAGNKGNA
ncbi:HD family phosphohydrolase [Betaproteobacteria bacterium]|nr:HD family phosphohydrolase [Betaproteobacteria bacterium]